MNSAALLRIAQVTVEDALESFGATVRAVPLDPPAVLAMIEGR